LPFTTQPEHQAEDLNFDAVDRQAFLDLCAARFRCDDTIPRSACER